MSDCTFEIEKNIAVLSGNEGEVQKRVNIVSWNGKQGTIDIRAWSSKGKPYKGIALTADEAKVLKEALNGLEMLK